eukprot:75280-Pyramimonas_sp.AAC.1
MLPGAPAAVPLVQEHQRRLASNERVHVASQRRARNGWKRGTSGGTAALARFLLGLFPPSEGHCVARGHLSQAMVQ